MKTRSLQTGSPGKKAEDSYSSLWSSLPEENSFTTEVNSRQAHSVGEQDGTTGKGREPQKQLLTVREVADLLRVPVSWVYGRTRKRSVERLPGYRLGKYWRFREDEVIAWVSRHGSNNQAA